MPHWAQDAIHYQVNLRAIANSHPRQAFEGFDELDAPAPNPPAPLQALRARVHRLKDFGVTQIHLMPPFLMGRTDRKGIGSPYAVRDYTAIDPEFGTREMFGALIDHAHALGIKVILGIVPNHTSRDHVWVSAHPDYYVTTPAGVPAFDLNWSDTAKLDYTRPALRAAMRDVYAHWLNFPEPGRGVDGFRVDMAHFINDRSFWNETLPELRAEQRGRDLLFLAECYGFGNNRDLFERGFDAAYDDDLYKCWQYFYAADAERNTRRIEPAEALENADFAPWLQAYREGGVAGAVRAVIDGYLRAGETLDHPIHLARYTDNHDEGRGLYRFGAQAVRAFHQLVFLLPQTIPFLLSGQEFGALNRPPIHAYFGVCDKGFPGAPGIELEGNVFARTPEARKAWHDFYHRLIDLRRREAALRRGALHWIDAPSPHLLLFERKHKNRTLRCAVNLGPDAEPLPPEFQAGDPVYGRPGKELAAYAACVLPA